MTFSKEHQDVLRALGVEVVYLFGSRTLGAANDASDYDVGIVFRDPATIADRQLETYQTLYSIVSEYLPDQFGGAHPDLSFLQFANAALEMSAIDGVVLFEADPRSRLAYEEEVIKRYDDYRHLRNVYEEATFAAFVLNKVEPCLKEA
ncbi:MAG: nucleotidyltransferase domain-containing protein [Patescibacteria group bacterium]